MAVVLFMLIATKDYAQKSDTLNFPAYGVTLIKCNNRIINNKEQKNTFFQNFTDRKDIYNTIRIIYGGESFFRGLHKKDIESMFGRPKHKDAVYRFESPPKNGTNEGTELTFLFSSDNTVAGILH